MATTTTLALGSSLGCDLWAGVDCTDTADTVVGALVPVLACSACAARHAEVTAAPQAAEPPF